MIPARPPIISSSAGRGFPLQKIKLLGPERHVWMHKYRRVLARRWVASLPTEYILHQVVRSS